MNRSEFNQWKTHYLNAFPQTRAWLADKTKVPDSAATLETWCRTLKAFPLVICTTVTDRIIDGELEPIDARWRDQTALTIRAYAGRIMDDEKKRLRKLDERENRPQKRTGEVFPAGKLFVRASELWKELRASGLPDDEIRDRVSDELDVYLDQLCPAWE